MTNLPDGGISFTAAYSGDSGYWTSSAPRVGVRVHRATTTSIASSPNPSNAQQNVTFTITVAKAYDSIPYAPAGTVELLQGPTVLASGAVTNGSATITSSFSAGGSYPLTAHYISNGSYGDYGDSTSAIYTQVVKTASTTSVTAQPNPAAPGQSVTITATVSPAGATGSVQFLEGATTLATVTLAGGAAIFSTSALSSGAHVITASYSGDSANLPSSSSLNVTVKTSTTTTLTAQPNPAVTRQPVTLTAIVSPSAATGTVEFLDGVTSLGIATLSGGSASISPTNLSAGAHTITANYSGDNGNVASSGSVSLTVKTATTTAVSSNKEPGNYGLPVQLVAKVTPSAATGTVEFFEGAQSLGSGPLTGGTVTVAVSGLSVGSHSITCIYSGDSNYGGSTSSPFTQTIDKGFSSLGPLSSTPNPSDPGQSVSIPARVFPATVTGTVQFLDGATVLGSAAVASGVAVLTTTSLPAGSHSLSASYSGDANWQPASTTDSYTHIVRTPTTTALTLLNNPQQWSATVQFKAQVSPGAATGTVQFFDGQQLLGALTVSGGLATFATNGLGVGSHSIQCVYSGDGAYIGSGAGPATETITKAAPAIAVGSSPNPSSFGQSVTLTATLPTTATGTVQFSDGAVALGTAAVLTTAALAVGVHSLSGSYSGDGNYQSAVSPSTQETVNKAGTVTTLISNQNPGVRNKPVVFTATVSPSSATGKVRFSDGSTELDTVKLNGGVASLSTDKLGLGMHPITATYLGDGNYNSSVSATFSETINQH